MPFKLKQPRFRLARRTGPFLRFEVTGRLSDAQVAIIQVALPPGTVTERRPGLGAKFRIYGLHDEAALRPWRLAFRAAVRQAKGQRE